MVRNRASTQRISHRPVLTARVDADKRNEAFEIHALSLDGAEMTGPLVLAVGQRIRIALASAGESVEVLADVVRVNSTDLLHDGITVQFVAPSPAAGSVITRLMSERCAATQHVADDEEERVTRRLPKHDHEPATDAPTIRTTRKKPR